MVWNLEVGVWELVSQRVVGCGCRGRYSRGGFEVCVDSTKMIVGRCWCMVEDFKGIWIVEIYGEEIELLRRGGEVIGLTV